MNKPLVVKNGSRQAQIFAQKVPAQLRNFSRHKRPIKRADALIERVNGKGAADSILQFLSQAIQLR
jgi:hypothetical protein